MRGVDALLDVATGLGQDLPHLARHGARDVLLALHEQIADAVQHLAAERRGGLGPLRESSPGRRDGPRQDRKSTRLNSSHLVISYAVFCLKKKKKTKNTEHHAESDRNIRDLQANCMAETRHE